MSKANLDNHANQLNPNNDAYWQSRGYDERPDNWSDGSNETKPEQGKSQEKDSQGKSK